MQVTETQTEGLRHEFKIVVPAADIEQRMESRLKDLGAQVRLPGFRPGKVPMPLLRKRYAAAVRGEVLEDAVNDSSRQTISERGLRPALQPKIEVTSFPEGGDLEYTMAVEVIPEIPPIDFGAIELERPRAEVTDETVETGLARIAAMRKRFKPPAEPRPAQLGDEVVIDYRGRVDGEERPGMTAEGHTVELGSHQLIDGFESQLVGHPADEPVTVTVTFPDDYHVAELRGKTAVFEVTIKEIREPVPTGVDEELAKELGFEDLETLHQAVRRQTEREFAEASRARVKRTLLDKLAAEYKFEVPAGMVEVEFDSIWRQVQEALKHRREHHHDHEHDHAHDHDHEHHDHEHHDHEHHEHAHDPELDKPEEQLKAEYREIAERRVRLGLLLAEIGRTNNITVSPEELNQAVYAEARRYRSQYQKVIEFFRNTPQAMESLRAPLLEDKVVDFILEMAKVHEQVVTPDELLKEPEEETPQAAGEDAAAGEATAQGAGGSAA